MQVACCAPRNQQRLRELLNPYLRGEQGRSVTKAGCAVIVQPVIS